MVIQHHIVRVFSPTLYLQIAKRYWILDGNKSFMLKKNCVRSCEISHILMIEKIKCFHFKFTFITIL